MSKVLKKNKIRRNLLLRALFDHKQLSLSDLHRITGITLPVITNIVTLLKEDNLVLEVTEVAPTQAGRPPSVVKLNSKAGYCLGIDIGRKYANYIVLDLEQNIICEVRKKSIPLVNDISIIDELEKEINSLLKNSNVKWDKILGIGLSIPGIVRGREGISETYLNFGNKPLGEYLQERFNKPVHIEHDAKAMALGELKMGAAKNTKNTLCLNVGWGLGLGIIINGSVYYGHDGFASEFGHIQVLDSGPLCECGKRGCLETVSSGRSITMMAKERISNGEKSIITNGNSIDIDSIDAAKIINAANEGDHFSIEIIEEAGKHLGKGIGMLINILNPECIILGGGISRANQYLIDSIKTGAMKHSLVQLNKNVKFITSSLGHKAGALGVATLAVKDLFEVDHLNPSAYV